MFFLLALVIHLSGNYKLVAFVHQCHTIAVHSDNDAGKSKFSCQTPSKVFSVPNTHCLSLFKNHTAFLGLQTEDKKMVEISI